MEGGGRADRVGAVGCLSSMDQRHCDYIALVLLREPLVGTRRNAMSCLDPSGVKVRGIHPVLSVGLLNTLNTTAGIGHHQTTWIVKTILESRHAKSTAVCAPSCPPPPDLNSPQSMD